MEEQRGAETPLNPDTLASRSVLTPPPPWDHTLEGYQAH